MNYNNINKTFKKHLKLFKESIDSENDNLKRVVKTVIIVTNPKNNIDPNDVPDIEKDDVAKYVSKLYNYLLSIPGNTNVSIVPYNNSKEKGLSIVFVVDGKTVKEVKEELTNLRISAENWARREGLQLKIIWHIDKE